jgi:hypothetical protein
MRVADDTVRPRLLPHVHSRRSFVSRPLTQRLACHQKSTNGTPSPRKRSSDSRCSKKFSKPTRRARDVNSIRTDDDVRGVGAGASRRRRRVRRMQRARRRLSMPRPRRGPRGLRKRPSGWRCLVRRPRFSSRRRRRDRMRRCRRTERRASRRSGKFRVLFPCVAF